MRAHRRTILAIAALALALGAAAGALHARTPDAAPYRLTALRAQLFFSQTGALSRDLLSRRDLSLWNTIIGEGNGGGASSQVLVVAEVTGEAGSYEDARRVELTARAGGKVLVQRTEELGVLSAQGKGYVGFWLYDVGCERVTLRARIVGQPQQAVRTAVIPFECGE